MKTNFLKLSALCTLIITSISCANSNSTKGIAVFRQVDSEGNRLPKRITIPEINDISQLTNKKQIKAYGHLSIQTNKKSKYKGHKDYYYKIFNKDDNTKANYILEYLDDKKLVDKNHGLISKITPPNMRKILDEQKNKANIIYYEELQGKKYSEGYKNRNHEKNTMLFKKHIVKIYKTNLRFKSIENTKSNVGSWVYDSSKEIQDLKNRNYKKWRDFSNHYISYLKKNEKEDCCKFIMSDLLFLTIVCNIDPKDINDALIFIKKHEIDISFLAQYRYHKDIFNREVISAYRPMLKEYIDSRNNKLLYMGGYKSCEVSISGNPFYEPDKKEVLMQFEINANAFVNLIKKYGFCGSIYESNSIGSLVFGKRIKLSAKPFCWENQVKIKYESGCLNLNTGMKLGKDFLNNEIMDLNILNNLFNNDNAVFISDEYVELLLKAYILKESKHLTQNISDEIINSINSFLSEYTVYCRNVLKSKDRYLIAANYGDYRSKMGINEIDKLKHYHSWKLKTSF